MLTHFANDLGKLGTNIAGLSKAAQDAIIAQGIEWYYWQGTDYAGKECFTQTGELLQYTTAQGAGLTGAQNKASDYVRAWLNAAYTDSTGDTRFAPMGTSFDQWNVAAGSGGVSASALDATKTQIFIGGAGADTFTGGDKDDVFLAGGGNDTLNGGAGSDLLYGGAGSDTYQFSGNWGKDTIVDADGQGSLTLGGDPLKGGKKVADHLWQSDDEKTRYLLTSSGDLIVSRTDSDNTITIRNWQSGGGNQLGIVLDDAPAPKKPVEGALFFNGDQRAKIIGFGQETQFRVNADKPTYGTYAWGETSWAADGTLNNGVAEADFSDVIDASVAGANGSVIHGWGGNDALSGSSGKDDIFGDAGDDLIGGGAGSDNIRGGDGKLQRGLDNLMAVWFDRPAYVFAPAPFQASADARQARPNCRHKRHRLTAYKASRGLRT
jgi:Ca2+-binding RTX toxin-like protein